MIIPLVPYSLHLVDDGFLLAENLNHPDFSGTTRFYYFFDGGLRADRSIPEPVGKVSLTLLFFTHGL